MKRFSVIALSLALIASPALALKVTNLDDVAHNVELSGNGAPQIKMIAPGQTEYFLGASQGFLALRDPAPESQKPMKKGKPAKRDSVVHADGMLSGIIGNERTERIPADPDNGYVIWQDGSLTVQSRMKTMVGR